MFHLLIKLFVGNNVISCLWSVFVSELNYLVNKNFSFLIILRVRVVRLVDVRVKLHVALLHGDGAVAVLVAVPEEHFNLGVREVAFLQLLPDLIKCDAAVLVSEFDCILHVNHLVSHGNGAWREKLIL